MPGHTVILSIIYCVVMFGVKIISQQCQKTTVTSEYVENVITGEDGAGEKTMQFCLQVARSNLLLSKPCFKTEHVNLKICDESCHDENTEDGPIHGHEFPDILSSDGTASKESEHQFVQNLKSVIIKHKGVVSSDNP